jgi:hypothetical protein
MVMRMPSVSGCSRPRALIGREWRPLTMVAFVGCLLRYGALRAAG